MKLRSAFVSNSSTCSFVIAGWFLRNKTGYCKKEWCKKFGLDYEDEDEFLDFIHAHGHVVDDGIYIGKELAHWSDQGGGCDENSYDFEEIAKELAEYKEKFGFKEKAKIFSDTYMC